MPDKTNFLLCVLFVFLTGCSSSQEIECSNEIPTPNANDLLDDRIFELILDSNRSDLHIGDEISLQVINLSNHSIWFPSDLNLFMINRFDENDFEILQDLSTPSQNEPVILEGKGSKNDVFEFFVNPNLLDFGTTANIEILVSGYIYQNGQICKGRYYSKINVEMLPRN